MNLWLRMISIVKIPMNPMSLMLVNVLMQDDSYEMYR